jgi:LCP family protein required for cell wall assembly
MADRPRGTGEGNEGSPDEPDYNWLYGSKSRGVAGPDQPPSQPPSQPQSQAPSQSQARPPRDPEPTQVLPTMSRPSAPQDAGAGGPSRPRGSGVQPVPPPTPPKEPKAPRRRGWFFWLRIVLLLWVVFLVAVPAWAWTKIDKVADDPGGNRPANQPGTTYLLVGSDSRAGLTRKQELSLGTGKASGQRTDTIMLLHTGSGPNLLMSIPRDSIVPIPGHGTTKINAAYAYGGAKLLIKTIEQNTGIRVDEYVEIGFGGFVNVVDAVGGITICPTSAMKDPLANLNIKKGCQDANGKKALGYARSRHTSGLGDIDRALHQREVVSAVGDKAVSPWSILNPVRYFRLASSGADALTVGKHTGMIATMKFAWAMTRVDGKNGLTCGVPIADLAVHWDRERALELFKLIKEDRTEDVSKSLCRASGLKS